MQLCTANYSESVTNTSARFADSDTTEVCARSMYVPGLSGGGANNHHRSDSTFQELSN